MVNNKNRRLTKESIVSLFKLILALFITAAFQLVAPLSAFAETEIQKCEREMDKNIAGAEKDKTNVQRLKLEAETKGDQAAIKRANKFIETCDIDIATYRVARQNCSKVS